METERNGAVLEWLRGSSDKLHKECHLFLAGVLVGLLYLQLTASQRREGPPLCPHTYVDCECSRLHGNRSTIQIDLPTVSIIDETTGMPRCIAIEDPLTVCENRNCVIIPNDNFDILFQKGRTISLSSNDLQEDYGDVDRPHRTQNRTRWSNESGGRIRPMPQDPLMSLIYPIQVIFPRGATVENSHRRVERDAYGRRSSSCRVPELSNSEVTCWKWPDWQSCKQKCIYGHGIEQGSTTLREMTYSCRISKNKWDPSKVKDCEPFINCKIRLRAPGDLSCVEPTEEPPYCDIDCSDYDDYHSTGHKRFTCDEKTMLGQKKPKLPSCVYLEEDEDGNLLKPPAELL